MTREQINERINQRVAAGMALLDDKSPGWDQRIDLATLEMRHGDRCIIGQAFGAPDHSFWSTCTHLFGHCPDALLASKAESYGFYSGGGYYTMLETAWKEAITARHHAVVAARTDADLAMSGD